MLIRHLNEATQPYVRKAVDPALLTWDEYYNIVNDKDKHHESTAYNYKVRDLNRSEKYDGKTNYPILVNRIKLRGIQFEIRLRKRECRYTKTTPDGERVYADGELVYMTPEEVQASGYETHTHHLAIFNPENECVGIATDDEWGCILVAVAQEYKGFGLGMVLGRLIYSFDYGRTTGGVTPAGHRLTQQMHREWVRDYAKTGMYSHLVKTGQITVERVKEILASTNLESRPVVKTDNLGLHDPKDWLLFGDGGCFILYDRKLREFMDQGPQMDHFRDAAIKGLVYCMAYTDHRGDNYGIIKQIGGVTPLIKRFMLKLAMSEAAQQGEPIRADKQWNDDEVLETLDPSFARLEGRFAHLVGEPINFGPMVRVEAQWRRSFDRYDEFKNGMMELAYGKFEGDPSDKQNPRGW